MAEPKLPLHGKDVSVTWFVGATPLPDTDNAQSITIREVNTQHSDKLLGRATDRLDETPGHWELDLKSFHVGPAIINALLAQKAQRAANQTPLDVIAMGLKFIARDGNKYGYILTKMTTNITLEASDKDGAIFSSFKCMGEELVPQVL